MEPSVDVDDELSRWTWGGLFKREQRAIRAENDDGQMFLCTSFEEFDAEADGRTISKGVQIRLLWYQ